MGTMETIELVLIGHPDKVCDGIAEEIKKQNPNGRNAIEVTWFNDEITIGGETNKAWDTESLQTLVKNYLQDVIYLTDIEIAQLTIRNKLNKQSQEINTIVGSCGTGDNGIFYGGWNIVYSPIIYALKNVCLELDGKLLANMGFRTDGKLIADIQADGIISRIVLNIAMFENINGDTKYAHVITRQLQSTFYALLRKHGIKFNKNCLTINPKGNWYKCFGFADSGLTGRKIACDAQSGLYQSGGGAWFGKDFSKADYSIPIYLIYKSKQIAEGGFNNNVILKASTIIGDTKVLIKGNCINQYQADYKEIMEFAKKTKITILGGFDFSVEMKEL
jgi:S-adenosylmethionine synthetase